MEEPDTTAFAMSWLFTLDFIDAKGFQTKQKKDSVVERHGLRLDRYVVSI